MIYYCQTVVKPSEVFVMKQSNQINWLWLVISLIGLVGLSFGLAYLLQDLGARFQLPLYELAWLAYLSVFGTTLLCNFTIIAPVPVATAIMIAAATRWNPVMVALAASLGGILGELQNHCGRYEKWQVNPSTPKS